MTYFEISFLTDVTNKSSELNIHRIYDDFKENHVVILINLIVQVSQVDITDINNKCITDINDILNHNSSHHNIPQYTIYAIITKNECSAQCGSDTYAIFYCFM